MYPRLPRHSRRSFSVVLALAMVVLANAQFYSGSRQEYGKNRVQYQEFLWQQFRFKDMEVFFYKEGVDIAKYTAQAATVHLKDLEKQFDFALDERLQFIVYNSLTDFRQSNIGIAGVDGQQNIGGLTRIVGTKIFVYYEGDHALLDRQIRSGIAHVIIDQMMYGGNWRDVLKSSTFMNLPDWYTEGIMSYFSQPWDADLNNRIRDGVLSGRYDKFNRLEGNDAKYAGHMVWKYVADVYGPGVMPNILYMTRVSRNPESGFLFVLGVSLKTLTKECLAYYKGKFAEEDRQRQEVTLEPVPIKTKKWRTYSEFKQSPNGRYFAWVSNEKGQYKVWVQEAASGKRRRIIKGEKKLDRIVDRSFPVLAWHPGSQALSYALEKRGELYMRTYTVDDRKTSQKPILQLDKILSMDYSPDGRNMVFSAVRQGRTDLFYYFPIGNRQEQLTNDQFDDLDPQFVDGGERIVFSSDRDNDTLRSSTDIGLVHGTKDIYLLDLETRSPILTRLTDTPSENESQPSQYDTTHYTFLSDGGNILNRYLVRYDSTISHIDTTVHYRYFSVVERSTDLQRSILEQDVNAQQGRYTQIVFNKGKYNFFAERTVGKAAGGDGNGEGEAPTMREAENPTSLSNDMSPVVKVKPQFPRATGDTAIDVRNYVFLDEQAKATDPTRTSSSTAAPVTTSTPLDTVPPKPFTYPDQRNYNLNFAIDGVVTQVDNSYGSQFYQVATGPDNLNPGLSALTRMGISDLFEDYKIVGGFRLALDLSNNDYLLAYENLKRRLDKRISFQRQALQLQLGLDVIKVHTHNVRYQISWPFSELASVRASILYRNDRYVVQSIDPISLRSPNGNDNMLGGKLEYIYDSSMPRGLNLWTGWKLKLFAEYYQQTKQQSDMQVIGLDLRHSLRIHRDMIWVTRLAGSSSFGNRKVAFFLGGVDNWLFAKVDNSIPIDVSQNYFYQSMAVPMRGFFYGARNGTSFAVLNTEVRLPLFRYLLNRPIRSDFLHNFQLIAFGDAGSAWTGSGPYADDNSFNRVVIPGNPLTITLVNNREPILASYGVGLRARLLGYFVRADWAWGIDDGVIQPRVFHFSLALDI